LLYYVDRFPPVSPEVIQIKPILGFL